MSAMDVRGTLTFEPIPEGTRMRWHWELAPRGFLKLLTPLMARMGRRQEEAIWAGLKRCLEGQAAPGTGGKTRVRATRVGSPGPTRRIRDGFQAAKRRLRC